MNGLRKLVQTINCNPNYVHIANIEELVQSYKA